MSVPSAYKPSPLGYGGSARSSPFRRPQSPASSATLRQTPTPTRDGFSEARAKFMGSSPVTSPKEFRTSRIHATVEDDPDEYVPQPRSLPSIPRPASVTASPAPSTVGHGNALSQLQPSQVRTMREAFQILDRDSDGFVNREDVADMLNQLGLPSNAGDVSHFFPPSAPQTMSMALFLNSIATSLVALSPGPELLSAFSAFDDDDSGQIDVAELRDALLHTAPDPDQEPLTALDVEKVIAGFTGRRAFTKSTATGLGGKRGEVFRYQDFVNTVAGGNEAAAQAADDAEEP
ncbi:uncharacterized protein B0H64DRAFT_165998 [Chaetomium fimeti]|uniref:EF-hand domain-containing protein n=1 Tax=Chaetomium fimeti TaxID=1854472 RepID=A0AAE0HGW6_9PEZI|nr:hypothetical protein B0H64DRAFT_165998 [Chaetomium fimeti]